MRRLRLEYLPLDKIDVSLQNVRKVNLEEGLDELAKSIKEIGLQQPIVVYRKEDGRYSLIIGQRRYLACKKLGMKEIPAIIESVRTETDAIVRSFSENIHRLDLEYRDKMQVATELLNKLGTVNKVAKALGVTPQTVKNYLGYSAVPEPIKKMVGEGRLSVTTATYITRSVPNEAKAIQIAKKVTEIPRARERAKVVAIARENPERTTEEVLRIAKRQKTSKVTIDLTPGIAQALDRACSHYKSSPRDITTEALEEWLSNRGFVE